MGVSMQALDTGTDISSLISLLAIAFGLPVFGYLSGLARNITVGASSKLNKVWATVCLVLPLVFLPMMVDIDSDLLRRIWANSPYTLSLIAFVCGVIAPAGLITLILRLWRKR